MNTVTLNLSQLLILLAVLPAARGQECEDDPVFTFKVGPNTAVRDCDWLKEDGGYRTSEEKIAEFCVRGDVKGACSSTCGFCNCRDKFHYKFVNHRENERFCSWINATRVDGTPEDWCYTESEGFKFPTEIGNNCMFSCGFCLNLEQTETTAAPVPTPSPSLVPTGAFCEDDPSFMFGVGASSDSNNVLFTGCDYLSGISDVEKAELCSKGNIMGRCSKTCSFCTCRDDSTFTFLHRDKEKNCSWITSKPEKIQRRREKYCYTDDLLGSSEIGDECPFSCGFCQDYAAFPSPTPSISPTKLHSSVPSSNPSSFPSLTPSVSDMPSSVPSLSNSPSATPSSVPSLSSYPSKTPSLSPSISLEPSSLPSQLPSLSSSPSSIPSKSSFPSTLPSSVPSATSVPSDTPSLSPSVSNAPSRLPSQAPSLSYQPSVSLSPSSGPSSVALRTQIEAIYDTLLKTNYEDAYDAALAWFIQSANHPSLKLTDTKYLLDRFMLALFYNQNCNEACITTGKLSNWMSTLDHCTWDGVSCNTDGYVAVINLPQSGLSGSLPYLKMDDLEYLTLPENSLNGAIPNFDMGNLEQMILNDNSLENGIPAFTNMDNLLDMKLSNNNFSSIANVLVQCTKLVSITLTNNSHNLLVVDGDLCSASQNTPFILDLTGTTSNCV